MGRNGVEKTGAGMRHSYIGQGLRQSSLDFMSKVQTFR